VDLRRLRIGEWLGAAAGSVLVVSLFLPWYELERVSPSLAAPAPTGTTDVSAWEAYSVADVLLLISAAIAIALFVVTAVQRTAAVGIASDALAVLVTAPIAVLALIRVLNIPDHLDAGGLVLDATRTPFAWLGLLAALAIPAAALIAMRDERLSAPGRPTDSTGMPIEAPPPVEVIPAPPPGAASS
jgi:hypothetical protein